MNFGFTPPDPEKVLEAFERLKGALRKAAEADTGEAQPLFQKLSDTLEKVIDDSISMGAEDRDPMEIMKSMAQVGEDNG